jgi:uncharacterized protein YukE
VARPDVQVAVEELRAAVRNIDGSISNIDKVKQNLSAVTLTRDDFGSLWIMDTLHTTYTTAQGEHVTNIDKAKKVFEAAATALKGVADNYAKADAKSTVRTR